MIWHYVHLLLWSGRQPSTCTHQESGVQGKLRYPSLAGGVCFIVLITAGSS